MNLKEGKLVYIDTSGLLMDQDCCDIIRNHNKIGHVVNYFGKKVDIAFGDHILTFNKKRVQELNLFNQRLLI